MLMQRPKADVSTCTQKRLSRLQWHGGVDRLQRLAIVSKFNYVACYLPEIVIVKVILAYHFQTNRV
jgi:hypothetical protein